jgi:hypothetical protein
MDLLEKERSKAQIKKGEFTVLIKKAYVLMIELKLIHIVL